MANSSTSTQSSHGSACETDLRKKAQEAKDTFMEKAHEVKDAALEQAHSAKESVQELASSATTKASNAASAVGEKVHEGVASVGCGMKSLAGTLREKGPHEGMLGSAASSVASSLESGGRYLQEEGLSGMGQDLTNLIRRNPVPALLLGVGIGYLLARATRS